MHFIVALLPVSLVTLLIRASTECCKEDGSDQDAADNVEETGESRGEDV